jgi:hypothetical protein
MVGSGLVTAVCRAGGENGLQDAVSYVLVSKCRFWSLGHQTVALVVAMLLS